MAVYTTAAASALELLNTLQSDGLKM